jgi:hypothetical protein
LKLRTDEQEPDRRQRRQGERASNREALVTKGRRRKSGGHAAKECVLTLGIAVEDIATARLVYEAIQVAQSVKDLETRKHQPRAS